MEFNREVFDLMPPSRKTFNLVGVKIPNDKDIFFRAKQKETLDRYQAARRFMYELETNDWDHYFQKSPIDRANIYFQNVLKAQLYEAALLFYNTVVDLSWTACYVSAEYFIYLDGKPVEIEGERGSTFGTVFLDCPESRPSFYLQSLAAARDLLQ